MIIFLTGGSGFVGKRFITETLRLGHIIYATTRKNKKNKKNLIWLKGGFDKNWNRYLKKSDILVLFNKDENDIEKKIDYKIPIIHAKSRIKTITNYDVGIALKRMGIVAFSGIGRPEKFHSLLKDTHLKPFKFFPFPDHYSYSKKEINDLIKYANKRNLAFEFGKRYKEKFNKSSIAKNILNILK